MRLLDNREQGDPENQDRYGRPEMRVREDRANKRAHQDVEPPRLG